MRLVKLFLISVFVFGVVITSISFLFPSTVRLSKAINMRADRETIWKQVDDVNKWKDWNPLFANVNSADIIVKDNGGQKTAEVNGTIIQWQGLSNDVHRAQMTRPGRMPLASSWKCMDMPGTDSTTVQWYIDFKLKWYPWEKFSSLLLEKTYGPKMYTGLKNMKNIIETDRSSIRQ